MASKLAEAVIEILVDRKALKQSLGQAKNQFSRDVDKMSSFAEKIGKAFRKSATGVSSSFKREFLKVRAASNRTFKKQMFQPIASGTKKAMSAFRGTQFGHAATGAIAKLSAAAKQDFSKIKQIASSSFESISPIAKRVMDDVKSMFSLAGKGASKSLGSLGRSAVTAFRQASKAAMSLTRSVLKMGASITARLLRGAIIKSLKAIRVGVIKATRAVRALTAMAKTLAASILGPLAPLLGIGARLAPFAVLADTINTLREFEFEMANVKAISGATGKEFASLEKKAMDMGKSTIFTATQAAEAMTVLSRAGFKAKETMVAMEPALALAAAGQLEIAESSIIVARVMRGMQLGADDMGHAVDVMAKAFTSANTDLHDLGEAMKFVGPLASLAGKDIEETVAAIQILSDAGLNASIAGTGLRQVLSRIAQEGAEVTKFFNDLGVAVKFSDGTLRDLPDILSDVQRAVREQGKEADISGMAMRAFGERAGPAFAALLQRGGRELRRMTNELRKADGFASKVKGIQLDTIEGDLKLMVSAFEGAKLSLKEALLPATRSVLQAMTKLAPAIGNVVLEMRGLIDMAGNRLSSSINLATGFLKENMSTFSNWFTLVQEIMTNVGRLFDAGLHKLNKFVSAQLGLKDGIAAGVLSSVTELLDLVSLATHSPEKFFGSIGGFLKAALLEGAAQWVSLMKSQWELIASVLVGGFSTGSRMLSAVFSNFVNFGLKSFIMRMNSTLAKPGDRQRIIDEADLKAAEGEARLHGGTRAAALRRMGRSDLAEIDERRANQGDGFFLGGSPIHPSLQDFGSGSLIGALLDASSDVDRAHGALSGIFNPIIDAMKSGAKEAFGESKDKINSAHEDRERARSANAAAEKNAARQQRLHELPFYVRNIALMQRGLFEDDTPIEKTYRAFKRVAGSSLIDAGGAFGRSLDPVDAIINKSLDQASHEKTMFSKAAVGGVAFLRNAVQAAADLVPPAPRKGTEIRGGRISGFDQFMTNLQAEVMKSEREDRILRLNREQNENQKEIKKNTKGILDKINFGFSK